MLSAQQAKLAIKENILTPYLQNIESCQTLSELEEMSKLMM
jgi:hypothetical protein